MYLKFIKPIFDFLFAAVIILFSSPLLLIVAFLLSRSMQWRSPFFLQRRPGKNGKIFYLVKFKTMLDLFDNQGRPLPDKERITKLGHFVRNYSLDELPQFLNVIKGEMSIIGPRPLLERYLSLYTEEQMKRHLVKPGITGWAQINGRNSLTWTEKFKLDVWYAENCSFLLDFKIFFLTIKKVFIKEGINASSATTMPPFTGNN